MHHFKINNIRLLTIRVLIFFAIVMLFINFSRDKEISFIELPALEAVYAEGGSYSEDLNDSDIESIKEKEKILEGFMTSLKEREKALEVREKEIDAKYENLNSIKKDIEERLEELKVVKAGIDKAIDKKEAIHEANILKLAKVYESTPPEQAGPMLSGLDKEISAQILLKMNNMKAGKIWGFVDPKKAILISRELTKYKASKGR